MLDYKNDLTSRTKRGYNEEIAEQLEITATQSLDLMESFDRMREKYETAAQFEESFQTFMRIRREGKSDTSWYELGWELRKQALL